MGQSKPIPASPDRDEAPHATIPFDYDPITCPYITVQVRINGGKPLPFIVDTGLNEPVLISRQVARRFKLAPIKGMSIPATDNLTFHKVQLGNLT
jgi:predicted aspartyl protease